MTEPGFHLFTYGTLRGGEGAAGEVLEGCRLVGRGTVRGTLYDLGEYPALVLAGDHPVEGDIWWCPADVLPDLDRYEGVDDGLFRRVGARVGELACWVYVAGPALAPRLLPEAVTTADRRPGSTGPSAGPPPPGGGS
jgi:gamma-glutamylcyclotransferase (GGCT)/AIG2-like uncharacterized protein YtfP